MTTPDWDEAYQGATPPPWDIGRPQPAFTALADRGLLTGRVLDAGCGTGEHALLAAARGADATGVDLSPRAIEAARRKAGHRGLAARFEVADILRPEPLGLAPDTVLDSGLFHVFDEAGRQRYVRALAALLRPGGTCLLMCFSDRTPGSYGPRRVRQEELRAAFADGWEITSITAETFDLNPGLPMRTAAAWLATMVRR